ncbi:cadherin-23-like [Ruditapes philippinarum]|uniref:cadherin-23-like n=1 Tax=Ruditapes philippinarum TaxID=129788 RepID=UPI00295AE723|nr:cadherin-23-like [Ruditapes philippinarum]
MKYQAGLVVYTIVIMNMIGQCRCQGRAPTVSGVPSYVTFDEGIDNGTVLFTFTATSSDQDERVTVQPIGFDTLSLVSINQTYGSNISVQVLTEVVLNRDEKQSGLPGRGTVVLEFVVTDLKNNVVSAETRLYINDINDNDPVLNPRSYTWGISERPGNDKTFSQISATDADSGSNGETGLRYAMKSNSTAIAYNEMFEMDSISGVVKLSEGKELDYETNSYYQFNITVTDENGHGRTGEPGDLIIRVLDVQDSPPFFTRIPYRTTIVEENISVDTTVISVTATDGDSGVPNRVNYTILNGTCSSLFEINQNGDIKTTANIDRDTGDVYDASGVCILNVLAQEIDDDPNKQFGNTTAITDVTISVEDINDNLPKFGSTTYNATIQENTPKNVPITLLSPAEIMIYDADQGENARMALSLSYPNRTTCNDFIISPSTIPKSGSALIRVNNTNLLDYETIKSITFLIVAHDNVNSTTATVTLSITDMNDNNPQFGNSSYEFSIKENTKSNVSVGNITATDEDSGENSKIIFSISGGNGRFNVSAETGNIVTNCGNCSVDLDREKVDIFYMTYTATDKGGRSNSTSLIIHITDENDNAPVFNRRDYFAYIDENDEKYNTTPIIRLEATDRDEPETNNSKVIYDIVHLSEIDMNSNISIPNKSIGEIFLSTPVDYERLNNKSGIIQVTVQARDLGDPQKATNASVLIYVQDKNDNAPKFIDSLVNMTITENSTSEVGHLTIVGSVTATDADGTDPNNKTQYFIQSGAMDHFAINLTTGDIYVQINAKLDRENIPKYNITVIAIDQGSPPITGTARVVIDIIDVNDDLPYFNRPNYAENVYENKMGGTAIITCEAFDKDNDHELQYSIADVHGRDETGAQVNESLVKDFFGVNETHGIIYVKSELDREVAKIIVLTIMVEDKKAYNPSPQNAKALLTITLLDINDNAPTFLQTPYTVNVSENAQNPTILLTITAIDVDEDNEISYQITDGVNKSSFHINPSSGVFSKVGQLDREKVSNITLNISATDNGIPNMSTFTTIEVTVLDFNDNEPEFVNFTDVISINEDIQTGTHVLDVMAHDNDTGPNANLTFSFENDVLGKFSIDPINGSIFVTDLLDRESIQRFVLAIKVQDNPLKDDERKFKTKDLTIIVKDINDNTPIFTKTYYSTNIVENTKVGESVLTVSASDADETGNNSKISYSFSNDTSPSGLFRIDLDDGDIYVNMSLVGHVGSYVIEINAMDHGEPMLQNNSIVNITVLDVNLNKPIISNLPDNNTISVYECVRKGSELYDFNYTDADSGINAEAFFNISKVDDIIADTFEISPDGILKLKRKLDALQKDSYRFQVQVTDRGIPPLSSEKIFITVKVIDVDDHLPSFKNITTTLRVSENRPVGDFVGAVTADDPDEDSVTCYEINEPEMAQLFAIGKKNGSIVTRVELDYENKTSYTFSTSDYIEDEDTDVNGKFVWVFQNAGDIQTSSSLSGIVPPLSGVMDCPGDKKKHIICVSGNGSLINNKYYKEDISGYLIVPVNVTDAAGSDTVNVKIFLIGNSQILIMTVLGEKEKIAETKNHILKIYSDVTGYKFVYDWLEDHKTPDGRVETFKTDIYFHVVDKQTDRVLSADEAIKIIDGDYEKLLQAMQQFSVLQVVSSLQTNPGEDDSIKTVYILAAIIAVLALTVAIIIYVSLTTRNTYKRKLKAATLKPQDIPDVSEKSKTVIPGSNMYSRQANPLLDAEIPDKIEYDNMSMGSQNSLDTNSVGTPRKEGDYAQLEEKEVRMDMYMEDEDYSKIPENPLEAALKQYDMQNMQNKQENDSTDGIVSPHDMGSLQFENRAYLEELESTEI